MKKIVLISVLVLSLSTPAFARQRIMREFGKTYPNARSLQQCYTCHEPDGDDEGKLNYYGLDLQRVAWEFVQVEQLDSDGDGVINIDEINAGTNPGVKEE